MTAHGQHASHGLGVLRRGRVRAGRDRALRGAAPRPLLRASCAPWERQGCVHGVPPLSSPPPMLHTCSSRGDSAQGRHGCACNIRLAPHAGECPAGTGTIHFHTNDDPVSAETMGTRRPATPYRTPCSRNRIACRLLMGDRYGRSRTAVFSAYRNLRHGRADNAPGRILPTVRQRSGGGVRIRQPAPPARVRELAKDLARRSFSADLDNSLSIRRHDCSARGHSSKPLGPVLRLSNGPGPTPIHLLYGKRQTIVCDSRRLIERLRLDGGRLTISRAPGMHDA